MPLQQVRHLKEPYRLLSKLNMIRLASGFGYLPTKSAIQFMKPIIQHELAHCIEIDRYSRLTFENWRLHDPSPTRSNTVAAREIRTMAIAARLGDEMRPSSSSVLDMMLVPNPRYGWRSPKDASDWANDLFDKTYQAYTLDFIDHEWSKRAEYLNNWMEMR